LNKESNNLALCHCVVVGEG